jgi:hypothetical protein
MKSGLMYVGFVNSTCSFVFHFETQKVILIIGFVMHLAIFVMHDILYWFSHAETRDGEGRRRVEDIPSGDSNPLVAFKSRKFRCKVR